MRSAPTLVRKVSLAELKKLALQGLSDSPLRDDILSQPDEVASEEYLADCTVWLRLLKLLGEPQHGAPVG